MSLRTDPTIRAWARQQRLARWRSLVASCALVALAWPSLGPLPWIAVDSDSHHRSVAKQDAALDGGESSEPSHSQGDASNIPGSPTHPADHDCVQCQVLKHLARCVPSEAPAPELGPLAGCPVQPDARFESQHAGHVALLPPVRGPPPSQS